MSVFIRLHSADDVVIARAQLMSGASVEGVPVKGLIPPGHKVATRAIQAGQPVRRYNQIIGFASAAIQPGEHVHTHNLNMGPEKGNFERDYAIGQDVKPEAPRKHATFMGIKRWDLHWRALQCQLFSHGRTRHCRSFFQTQQPCCAGQLPQCRWRGGFNARYRLRHGHRRSGHAVARAHLGRLCHAC
ncbi:MAG: D-galactarate dehydratase [Pseudomonadota bacterium]